MPRSRNIKNPKLSRDAARRQLDLVQSMNRQALERDQVNPAVEGVIESYELAFRMQGELPRGDGPGEGVEGDPAALRHRHGARPTTSAGSACWPGASPRPACGSSKSATAAGTSTASSRQDHGKHAAAIDRPIAGLLTDLKARGLLDDTLVIWGGEFGRTPLRNRATAATTTTRVTPSGWPAAASRGA